MVAASPGSPQLMETVIPNKRVIQYSPVKVSPAVPVSFKPPISTAVQPKPTPTPASDTPVKEPIPGIVKSNPSNPNTMGVWSIVGGALGSLVAPGAGTALGGAIGSLVDASSSSTASSGSAGFAAYIGNPKRVGPWPDVTTLLNALTAAGDKDVNLLNAIKATYNQATGTAKYGDWDIAVISTQPIAIEQFKGASETGITRTTANYAAFQSAAASGTPIAQSNISAGPATNAVFPNIGMNAQQATQTQNQSSMNSPQSSTPVWMWPVIIITGIIATIVGLFFALKPSRR